jgi:hypothetical protein
VGGGDVEAAHLLPLPPRTLLLHLRDHHQTVKTIQPFIPTSYSTCLNLDHVPVGEPVVVQELGHVVPDPVRQNHHTLLPRLSRRASDAVAK